jgi:hypothetical protein
MSEHDQQRLLAEIRSRLDRSVGKLDPAVVARLDAMRTEALSRPLLQAPVDAAVEERLVNAARVSLDDSVNELDPAIAVRLEQSRKAALARASGATGESSPVREPLRTWLASLFDPGRLAIPAGAFATVCLLVTVSLVLFRVPGQPDPEFTDADVLLFASNEEIELYENLEFYLWLADNGLPN